MSTILAVYSVAAIVLNVLSHWYAMRHPIVDDLLVPSLVFIGIGGFLVSIAWAVFWHPDSMLYKKGVRFKNQCLLKALKAKNLSITMYLLTLF